MKFTDILEPGRVVHRLTATSRDGVLRELVERGLVTLEANTGLGPADADRVVKVLQERERLGSTGIKDGLAIPHGKLEGLDGLKACLGLHVGGLEFGALDALPSRVFIVLLAPEGAGGLHLKALARISRLFSDASLHKRLFDAKNARAVWDEIVKEDARYP
jgi:PTS system nitrogen regulatory IIA component